MRSGSGRLRDGRIYDPVEGGRYRLGPAAFRLASVIQSTRSLPRLMRPYLEELVAAIESMACAFDQKR